MNPIEQIFINAAIADKFPVTVFLNNGVKLQGRIALQDKRSISLQRDGMSQLVFKHSIATVMIATPFDFRGFMDKASVKLDDHLEDFGDEQ